MEANLLRINKHGYSGYHQEVDGIGSLTKEKGEMIFFPHILTNVDAYFF